MPPSGSHSKVKLNVRVPPAKKDEWKNALNDGETLTELVRRAVDREINNEFVVRENIEGLTADVDAEIDTSEITEQITELQGSIEALQTQIDASQGHDGHSEATIRGVAMDAVDYIPVAPDPDDATRTEDRLDYAEYQILQGTDGASMGEHLDGSADKIAGLAGEDDVSLVREALIYLETRTTVNVESVIVDGTRHWVQL